jgi:hypothetical protein
MMVGWVYVNMGRCSKGVLVWLHWLVVESPETCHRKGVRGMELLMLPRLEKCDNLHCAGAFVDPIWQPMKVEAQMASK